MGAAVALSANATRFFEQFGLGPQLASRSAEVSALIYRDGRTGRLIGEHPVGPSYRQRFGAPYFGIHRADLQAILSTAAGLDRIQLRKRLVGIDDAGARAALRFDDGSTARGRSRRRRRRRAFVGAALDARLRRRALLGVQRIPRHRADGHAPEPADPTALQFWMGPGGHLLHYPMGHDHINFLLVERHPTPWPLRDWVMPATEGEQLRHFAQWHPAVVEMITAQPVSNRWGLFHRPPLGRWTKGRVTLLGDAAHQLAPHHGQGANQSVEDAIVLAACLADAGSGPLAEALERYERLRRGRTRKVQYASISAVDVLHLPDGDNADRRNARLGSPEGALHHLGWIHEFDASTQEPGERQGGTWLSSRYTDPRLRTVGGGW